MKSDEYYVEREDVRYDYRHRTHEQLVHDVNVAHDFTRKLVREKDLLSDHLRLARIEIKVLTAVATIETAAIGILIKVVLAFVLAHVAVK
jgi:hypothetical protein